MRSFGIRGQGGPGDAMLHSAITSSPEPPKPDVSIVVPCFNAAVTLPETLQSIRAQTHANWEAICIDDGSSDETPRLLEAWSATDTRIRWARVARRCPAAARNAGVALARAGRVLFLDADDLARPDAVAAMLRTSRAIGDAGVVTAGYELLSDQGMPLAALHFPSMRRFSVQGLLRGNQLPPMTMVPTAALGKHPFDEDPRIRGCEDWDLWLRLAHAGIGGVSVPAVLFGYRLRIGSLSHDADRMHAAGRCVLARWGPRVPSGLDIHDAGHRLAWCWGTVAMASGQFDAIGKYLNGLSSPDTPDDFPAHVAGCLHSAFLFVHGARGRTWQDHAPTWLGQSRAWLCRSPIAAHAESVMDHLARRLNGAADRFAVLDEVLACRAPSDRILIYGVGANGLSLLEHIRSDPALAARTVGVADDFVGRDRLAALGLPIDEPEHWASWPDGTLVIVTPDDDQAMRDTLKRAGGREGSDFLILAACRPQCSSRLAEDGRPISRDSKCSTSSLKSAVVRS